MQAPRGDTRNDSLRARSRSVRSPQTHGPPGPPVPRQARRQARESGVGLRPAQPAVLAQLHASSAPPEPEARARLCWCRNATERFSGNTRGRSPAVAKAVARAPRSASPAAKVTGREDSGEALDGSPASACLAPGGVAPQQRTGLQSRAGRIREAGPHPPALL